MSEDKTIHPEIIFIRRSGGEEGGHKGGSWKIAYADFVTAMMAFFLVMWLINSANEATRARVASYFNPIKMTDATPSGKGIKEVTTSKSSAGKTGNLEGAAPTGSGQDEGSAKDAKAESDQMLNNPFMAIEAIVSNGAMEMTNGSFDIASSSVGDPFDPKAWEALRNGRERTAEEPIAVEAHQDEAIGKEAKAVEEQKDVTEATAAEKQKDGTEAAAAKLPDHAAENQEKLSKRTENLRKLLSEATSRMKIENDVFIEVQMTQEGTLIVLADKSQSGMFDIGSAKPRPALVHLVALVGAQLKDVKGDVIVRGHTDDRRFRKGSFDNWQLSSDRAHMASYMLMRGGLPESRIKRIEGHGSASLLIPQEPLADANRRVEFLLRDQGL